MKHTKLDKLLRDWAENHSVADKRMAGLNDRIASRVRAEDKNQTSFRERQKASRPRYVLAGLAATAVVLVIGVVLGSWLSSRFDSSGGGAMVTIHPSEMYDTYKVFAETQRVFDSGLEWVSETDGQVEIGLSDDTPRNPANSQPVFLKVLLLQRRAHKNQNHVLWKGNIMTGSEQVITVTPDPERPKNKITLWLYPLNSTGIVLDFKLDFEAPTAIHASSANHVVNQHPLRVLSTSRGGTTYEMYVAAAKLPGPKPEKGTTL